VDTNGMESFEIEERMAALDRRRRLDRESRLDEDAAAGRSRVFPEPDERPTPRAQWDEVHGRWLEWDAAADDWRVIADVYGPDRTVDEPAAGTGSADSGSSDSPDSSEAADPAGEAETWLPGEGQSLDDIE
jgi:hypothetical protein